MTTRVLGNLLLAAVAVGCLAACALTVRSDVNKAAFHPGQCRTFAWIGSFREDNPMRSGVANPVNESRLRTAITAHLQTIGVQLASGNADCLVGYGIGTTLVVDSGWGYPYYGWGYGGYWGWRGPYWGPYWGGWYGGPYAYRQGMIGIDLFDARTKEPLWHASVDQDLYGAVGADAEHRINVAVDALFSHFPT
jgi:hypothetical protein